MSEAMTKQLTQALKGYFRNEEFSDKVLHIIEMEGAVKLPMNIREKFGGLDEDEGDSSDEESCSDKSELNDADEQNDTDDLPVVNSDPDEVESNSGKLNDASRTDDSIEEAGSIPDDEIPSKLFHQCSFFMSKNILGDDIEKVQKLVQINGGEFINVKESATYIISHYLLPNKKKTAVPKERTIQWVEECIKSYEIKVSSVNVLYRPISVKSKPLLNLVLTFGECEENEKILLQQISERLGATHQDLLLTRQNNNTATVSTHFVICSTDKHASIQFNTAVEWSIPCVTKKWLLKCSETLQKVDETNYSVESIIRTNGAETAMNETWNEHAYSVFPVHSLILSISSNYFKALTSESGMREANYKNIVVKVNPGEGSFLELLIRSIYDQEVLKKLNIVDLLKVLELADQFLCDQLIEQGLEILETLSFETLAECNEILVQVQIFKSLTSISSNKIYKSMINFCANYLAKYFHSLECYPEKQNDFNMMPFFSTLVLLESGLPFLHHENSVIYFIVTWLSIDKERQTEYNIKKLLKKVRYEYISVGYFNDVLLINQVLPKWSRFYKWCANALLYHGFSDEDKSLKGLDCAYENRSIHSSAIQKCMLKLEYSEESIFKQSRLSTGNVIYQGYIFTPLITFIKNDNRSYDLVLNLYFDDDTVTKKEIKKFHLKFGIALGVFPGNRTNELRKMFGAVSTTFYEAHFRRFEVEYIKCNSFEKSIGTISEELYGTFKTEGIIISIVFGTSESSYWPNDLKVLGNVNVKNSEIRRNSTCYPCAGVHMLRIPSRSIESGKYF